MKPFGINSLPAKAPDDAGKVARLDPPATLAGDEKKVKLWNFVCADMANRDMLSSTYTFVIRELVETVALLDTYRPMLEEAGPLEPIYNKDGTFVGNKANPLFLMVDKLQNKLLQLVTKLGMTPRDIYYLTNPEATLTQPIEAVIHERSTITYFAD